MEPRKLVSAQRAIRPAPVISATQRLRRTARAFASSPLRQRLLAADSSWLDRALCVLVALLANVALGYGLYSGRNAWVGLAVPALVAAGWAASVLFDGGALRRARAVRAATARALRSRARNP